jgi:hypothetical protein
MRGYRQLFILPYQLAQSPFLLFKSNENRVLGRRSKCGGRVGPPFLVPTRERRCELTADASSVNESGKIENGKTHVFRGPRARTGWGCQEGPEEG